MDFSLSTDASPPEAVVTAAGELDIFTAMQLSERLQDVIDVGCRRVQLDLAGVTFADAAALRVLDRFHRQLTAMAGTLSVVSWSPPLLRLCRITGLDTRFGISDPVAS